MMFFSLQILLYMRILQLPNFVDWRSGYDLLVKLRHPHCIPSAFESHYVVRVEKNGSRVLAGRK